jgi:hypothetical protein
MKRLTATQFTILKKIRTSALFDLQLIPESFCDFSLFIVSYATHAIEEFYKKRLESFLKREPFRKCTKCAYEY